ncbi:MAG: glycosyltransferase family 2 protein [Chitinophagaceae bacterium]|nr:glycosyltransferase family 2 protein [Chitinophagaceae bacterium]
MNPGQQSNSQPFFTVIIPTYNRAHLIGKTIDSVLDQTFQDFEIVIVDNKSTDNTTEMLQTYLRDPRITLYVQKENYERSNSRNRGMSLATGKYSTFLDSDDIIYKDSLALAHDFALKNTASKVFHHYYETVDTSGKHVYTYSFPPPSGDMLKKLLQGNFLSCIGVFTSRDIYTKYLFDENKASLGSEDWDFWIRVVADHPLGVIPKVAAAIIQHDERTVMQNKIAGILVRKDYYMNKYRTNPELASRLGKHLHIFEAGFYLYTATVSYQARLYGQGYMFLFRAFLKYPPCAFTIVFWKILLSPIKNMIRK